MVTKMFAKWSAASLGRKTSVFWKRLLRSQKHCFFALLVMFTVTSVVYLFTGYREPLKPFPYNDKTNQIRMNEEFLQRDKGTGCDMAQLDPFSDVAMRYVKETPKIVCEGLDWVDCYHSKCYVIKEILSKMKDVVCNYKDIVHVNDQHYYIGDPVKVYGNGSYRLNSSDHVKVSCKGVDKNGLGIISQRWFGYKSGLRPVPKPLVSRTGRENTSDILILGFDSTSRNGFIRKMPKSYKFLKDVLNATIMKSYNIVGEGTSNALYPILTGLELPDWESFPKDKTMDHKTFLFHHLKNDGYRTAYFEDMPWIGTFQRFYHGFDSCPADHYLRSFLMEESSKGRKWWHGVKGRYCIGNVPQYGLLMNLTKQFLDLDGKHFCLTFIADISHDDFNVISTSDDDVVAFLQDFLDKGRQKNTLLIVMGDHGAKYESIRRTYQGRLEERLPLMTIKLPETLIKSRPNVQRVLEANAEVLTTPYDLHTTLLDVVGLRELANSYKVEGSKLERGLSMLEPIPKSRSCGDAGILPHWCACTKWRNVSRSDPVHQQAATVLAEYIDNITNGRREDLRVPCFSYISNVSVEAGLPISMIEMKLFLLMTSVIVTQAGTLRGECKGVEINGATYEEEMLYENLDRPYLLTVDYSTNDLYFSYSIDNDEDSSATARYNLDTKKFTTIEGVNNGFAQTVDQTTQTVYIGGSDGLYRYDKDTKRAELIGASSINIWTIFYKDVLYFSTYPSHILYTFSNGQITRFPDLEDTRVDNFIIDNDDYIFFTNTSGLYRQKKGTKDAVLYEVFEDFGVRGFALDAQGVVHACFQNGVYSLNNTEVGLKKIVSVDDAFGVAFDKDNNLIYSDARRVIRLKPTKDC